MASQQISTKAVIFAAGDLVMQTSRAVRRRLWLGHEAGQEQEVDAQRVGGGGHMHGRRLHGLQAGDADGAVEAEHRPRLGFQICLQLRRCNGAHMSGAMHAALSLHMSFAHTSRPQHDAQAGHREEVTYQ